MIPYWIKPGGGGPLPKWEKIILTIVCICIPLLGWIFIPFIWYDDFDK